MTDLRATIVGEISTLLEEEGSPVPEILDSSVLLETGLDSLGFAVLVTRLDDLLGYDPFSLMDEPFYPRTLGEFVTVYERFAP